MSHRDQLIQLLKDMGLPQETSEPWTCHGFIVDWEDIEPYRNPGESSVSIGEGDDGYLLFRADFIFDRNGKYVRHRIVE